MRLSQAFYQYISDYGSFCLRPRTIHLYGYWIKRTATIIGDKEITELCAEDLGRLRTELSASLSVNGYRVCFVALRSVLRYCRREDIPCFNYEKILIPKTEFSRQVCLTPTEVARMVENANSLENKLLIALLYSSALRVSEAMSLDRDQIVDRTMTVIGKGGKMRQARIDVGTEKILNEYLASRTDNSPALFITRNGDRLTSDGAYSRVRTVRIRAGIHKKVHPHTLRRSCATDLFKNGADIMTVARHLGHANISTTKLYLDIDNPYVNKEYDTHHTDVSKLVEL